LSLPEAGSSASEVAEVSVRIAADGGLYVDANPVTPEELTGVLEARLREAGTTEVTLEADRRVPHGRVVAAMDAARKAGATGLVVATRPEDGSEP
jgi:biopolymer transport protein ExbD